MCVSVYVCMCAITCSVYVCARMSTVCACLLTAFSWIQLLNVYVVVHCKCTTALF